MTNRVFKMIDNAFVILRDGGVKEFFQQLRRQLYDRDVQVGIGMSLEGELPVLSDCKVKYYLQPATPDDMEMAIRLARDESKQAAKLLAHRKWLFDCGIGRWYIARTCDTHEPCYIQSLIEPIENVKVKKSFRNWFPELRPGEVMLEGAYSFEKFRGNRLANYVIYDLARMYKEQGFTRMITYTEKSNTAAIRSGKRQGMVQFEEVPVLKVLFMTRRKFGMATTVVDNDTVTVNQEAA